MLTQLRKSEIKKSVLQVLKGGEIHSLPVDLNRIFNFYHWGLLTFVEAKTEGLQVDTSQDGYTIAACKNDKWKYTVVYDDACIPARVRWTIAHEIGHIALKHALNRANGVIENEEAQYFAEQLLSPIAVVAKMGARTETDVMNLCNVSSTASGWRMPDLKRHFWYFANYGYTADDRAFLAQFEIDPDLEE